MYGWAYVRGLGLLLLALLLPLIIMGAYAAFFARAHVSEATWRLVLVAAAAVELALLALAAIQWKHAWALMLDQRNRGLIAGFLVALSAVLLGGVVALIAMNLTNTCSC
jgi:uncharacterized membrane protein